MAVDVTTEILIARPQHEVATFAANPDNAPQWYANIMGVQWRTPPPLRVGSRVAFVARFLGRRLEYIYEVTQLDLPNRLVMGTSEGPFPMETTYAWQPRDSGSTHMALRNRGNPTGFSALLAPFMAVAMKRANRKDLRLLKALLEGRR